VNRQFHLKDQILTVDLVNNSNVCLEGKESDGEGDRTKTSAAANSRVTAILPLLLRMAAPISYSTAADEGRGAKTLRGPLIKQECLVAICLSSVSTQVTAEIPHDQNTQYLFPENHHAPATRLPSHIAIPCARHSSPLSICPLLHRKTHPPRPTSRQSRKR